MPLFDTPLAAGVAKLLVTACKTDIFNTLATGAMSLKELASRVNCDPQGLLLLMQILTTAGYLRCRNGLYSNTAMTRRWLTDTSPYNIAPYIIHTPDIIAIWEHAPEVIHTNAQAMRMPYEEDSSTPEMQQLLARHYAGLASLATALGGEIIGRIHLPRQAQKLLDVGGSHAGYSGLLCKKYRHLQATILDLPAGNDAGKLTAKRMGLEQRMQFIDGDIVKDDFPCCLNTQFDAALYFHIAHLLPAELNQAVLVKVARTIKRGGVLAFVDQVTDQTHGSRLASLMVQFMALTMRTVGGTCYPFPTVKLWLENAGFAQVQHHRLLTPGATLITAVRQ